MKNIIFLRDYKGFFGSKYIDYPYRSGFDQKLLTKFFCENGLNPVYMNYCDLDLNEKKIRNQIFLYTSSEDLDYFYKSYIEDIVYGLEQAGAIVIPQFKYLRANNNKVFMEILRKQYKKANFNTLKSKFFGTYEEAQSAIDEFIFPVVIKTSGGASGKGVFLCKNKFEYVKVIKKISRTKYYFYEFWDLGRTIKHKGYVKDSKYRKKFIVQEYLSDLKNDWKIYIFGNRYFIFYRPLLKGRGIKASGGGYENYFYGEDAERPHGIFDFAYSIYELLDTPHVSLDIAFDGDKFHLLEFQCVYFGTAGIVRSNNYYIPNSVGWKVVNENLPQEKVYADSICFYIKSRKLII